MDTCSCQEAAASATKASQSASLSCRGDSGCSACPDRILGVPAPQKCIPEGLVPSMLPGSGEPPPAIAIACRNMQR